MYVLPSLSPLHEEELRLETSANSIAIEKTLQNDGGNKRMVDSHNKALKRYNILQKLISLAFPVFFFQEEELRLETSEKVVPFAERKSTAHGAESHGAL